MRHLILGLILFPLVASATPPPSRIDNLVVKGAQAIGTTSEANSKAALEISSTTKGFLPPRMTEAKRDAISSPPEGLELYNTTSGKYNRYNGSAWVEVVSASETQTLTNKTLTSPTINNGTVSGAAITGGSIDNTPIGATTQSTVKATSLTAAGTGGAGFLNLIDQASDPSSPSSGWSLFSTSTGKPAWKLTSGRVLSFDLTGLTADRAIAFPDAATTLVGTDVAQTLTNKDLDGGTASNSNRFTLPKDTLSNLTGLTRKEGTVVYATDQAKPYFDDGTNLKPVGSGSGSGDVNYVGNPDAETDATGFTAYADAAASSPVDGNSGSPTITCTRSTTSPLSGAGSFLFTKDAADRQGEGCAIDFTVDRSGQGKSLSISFDTELVSGAYSLGNDTTDSDITMWVYGPTDGTPTLQQVEGISGSNRKGNLLLTSIGTTSSFQGRFNTAASGTAYRLILHESLTGTSAFVAKLDTLKVGKDKVTKGAAVTKPQSDSLSLTFSGIGTVSGLHTSSSRVGSYLKVTGQVTAGTVAASTASIDLPSGYTLDTSGMGTNQHRVGTVIGVSSGSAYSNSSNGPFILWYDGSDNDSIFISSAGTTGTLSKANGNGPFVNSQLLEFEFEVPIQGWDSGAPVQTSSQFNISSYLGSGVGTRVTGGAPDALGEYRSYLRNAGAQTYSETNGTPTNLPTYADGIRIYNSGNGSTASADSSGEPSRYEIFVGKNKIVQWQWYLNTGRTGFIDVSPYDYSTTVTIGCLTHYDPSTGIATVVNPAQNAAIRIGRDVTSNSTSAGVDAYFDIIVSDSVIPVQIPGLVTSNSTTTNERIERARISAPSAGACAVSSESGDWINGTPTSGGTGACTVSFNAGIFSATPTCTCTVNGNGGRICAFGSMSSSSIFVSTLDHAGNDSNESFNLICMGPR